MGHSRGSDTLFVHYRAAATPAQAEAYWNIQPHCKKTANSLHDTLHHVKDYSMRMGCLQLSADAYLSPGVYVPGDFMCMECIILASRVPVC